MERQIVTIVNDLPEIAQEVLKTERRFSEMLDGLGRAGVSGDHTACGIRQAMGAMAKGESVNTHLLRSLRLDAALALPRIADPKVKRDLHGILHYIEQNLETSPVADLF